MRNAEVAVAVAKMGDDAKRKRKKEKEQVDPMAGFRAAVKRVREEYGPSRLRSGADFPALERVPTGIIGLDLALGVSNGTVGFPRGRFNLIAGQESAGKTLVCLCQTREYQALGEPVVWIAAEPWDAGWATANGVDVEKMLVQPSESMEQTLDILAEFIRVMPNGLVVVDSFAQLTPKSEIEASFVEWQQGLIARIANKGFRNMQSGMNTASNEFLTHGPTVLIVQQFRSSISTGSDRVLPGGQGQLFAGTTITHLRGGSKIWYIPGNGEGEGGGKPKDPNALVVGRTFHYDVVKNKSAAPHRYGEFNFYTERLFDPNTGARYTPTTVNAHEMLCHAAVRAGVLQRRGSYYSYDEENMGLGQGVGTVVQIFTENPELRDKVYAKVLASEGIIVPLKPKKEDKEA